MIDRIRRWFDSLKNRAVVMVVLLVVLITVTATVIAVSLGQSELEAQARNQLQTHAMIIADDVDEKLAERFDAITRVAAGLTMYEEALFSRAQVILNRQTALNSLFHRLYLINHQGHVQAVLPEDKPARGIDVSDRPYYRQTLQQMTTLISKPIFSRDEGEPVVVVTAPIFDHSQRLIGILAGSIKLSEDSFLGALADLSIGQTGFVAMGTRSGVILVEPFDYPDLGRLNDNSPLHQAARRGEEGVTVVPMNSGGKRVVAYRQLNQAPWFVTVSLPTREAFEPIRTLTNVMGWAALILLILFIPLSLRMFSDLLYPLQRLAVQIRALHEGRQERPEPVGGGREIRELERTFAEVREERQAARQELEQKEAYFRSLSERAPIGIIQTDVLGRIEFANPAFEAIVGQPLARIRNQPFLPFIYRPDQEQARIEWERVQRQGEVARGEQRLYDPRTERIIWISYMLAPIQTPDRALGTVCVARDITHELEIEAELRGARARAERILEVLDEGVVMTDNHGFISFANPTSWPFLGSQSTVVGFNLFDLVRVTIDGSDWTFDDFRCHPQVNELDAVMTNRQGQPFEVELTMLRLDGEQAEQFVFVMRDDSERRRQEERLSWEASHDPLTRLSNRRGFNSALASLLQQETREGNPSVVMMIDLDHFKPVNDNGGHLLGDELLRHIADILRSRVRQSDMVARLGGDEFGVILPACGVARARDIAEALRVGIERLILEDNERQYGVTASIGLTAITPADVVAKDVVARADEAAYAAKAQGRNRVIVFGEHDQASEPLIRL
ncbi:sensor domain-containing diguanylate cyclase [Marinobacter bohaiensis]|uniref:sensor domain-containing diguanylate cyclase n=1 Tax=Marinobacter bohaiensis TaxID=2201898 RepID=UPI0013A69594|nr:diguanylate cyclase [Marinobacter bohaiensis]